MIRSTMNYITKPPPIPSAYIDGYLYVGIAFFGALTASFGSDEANKFISSEILFWLRVFCGATSAGLLALKMFRSDSFANHKAAMKAQGDDVVSETVTKTEIKSTTPPAP